MVKGNSELIFNDILPKCCANTCVQYNGQNDVMIDNTGTVLWSNQKAFLCLSEKCYCNKLEDILANLKSHIQVDIKENKVVLFSVIRLTTFQL